MSDPVPSSAISDATTGGLSLIVITGGSTGEVLTLQADGTYAPATVSAGIGGSVGSTDNRLVRSDGTGGSTVQSTGITVDDSNNVSGIGTLDTSGQIRSLSSVRCMQINDNINARQMVFGGGFIQFDQTIYLTNTLFLNGAGNTSISVSSSGVAQIGTTAANALGSLLLTNLTATALIGLGTYTVATLPSAAANAGRIAQVTDSSVTANGSAVAGGGANRVMVFSNGTSWDVVVA